MKDEEKSILEALETIRSVCECNACKDCPLGYVTTYENGGKNIGCKVKRTIPSKWVVNKEADTWRALL